MLENERAALERLGFRIVSESPHEIVAVRNKWYWDCLATNMTWVVFLRATGPLSAANMASERARMVAFAGEVDPFPLPSGFQHGRVAVPVYVADRVEQDAQALCSSEPTIDFGTRYFPAAYDRSSGQAHFLRRTPFFGAVYFGKFRWLVRQILDLASREREPLSVFGTINGLFMVAALVYIFVLLGQLFTLLAPVR